MTRTTQSSLDNALALGKQLYVLVLQLDLAAASGQERLRLRNAVGALAMRLADASVCRSRRRVLSLLDEATVYAHRVDVLLEAFDQLGMLCGDARVRGVAARRRVADLRARLDRLLGPKPDLGLEPEEKQQAISRLPSPSPASADGSTVVESGVDAAPIASWIGQPWLPHKRDMPDDGPCAATSAHAASTCAGTGQAPA